MCDNVTEISCEIVPYTKCKLEMINVDYEGYEDVLRPYTEKVCETFDKIIQHEKMTPKCYNETKLNCVTLWKEDDSGEKVSIFTLQIDIERSNLKCNFHFTLYYNSI